MFGDDILVRTLLMPPRLPRRWLARDRLDTLLSGIVDYPLTVVSASAGYGKSTALASFANRGEFPSIWFTLGEGCDDPLVFLVHLVHACRSLADDRPPMTDHRHATPDQLSSVVGERALTLLEHGGSGAQVWSRALESLVNDLVFALSRDTVLILDDYHTVDDHADVRALLERLIAIRPPELHLVLSTRRRPQLECMSTLQVRGELLEIREQDLAFSPDEIAKLFSSAYGHGLDSEEAPVVNEQTGGWAIALQLVWQDREVRRQARRDTTDVPSGAVLEGQGREALFAYLAREVLASQPSDTQSFLLRSSILSELDPAACDCVLGITGSASRLETLYRKGLFLTAETTKDGGADLYRYHPLFHSFLRERAVLLPEWNDLHMRAAAYYREVGAGEQVLEHLLATGSTSEAALELESWAPGWLKSGRVVTLLAWTEQLPEEVLATNPRLLIARGDAARLLAHFDTAQRAYDQALGIYEERKDMAGQAEALRGQALVYLDTLQPLRAEDLLRQAFKLLSPNERAARAELLGLIAENRLNRGRADQALRLYTAAGQLDSGVRSSGSSLHARILLQLGRLAEARAALEAELPHDRESPSGGRPSEAHREITLLLSLIGALEGDPQGALRYAQDGLEVAHQLGSGLLEAGALICAGHALQLARPQDDREANESYLQAIALADSFQVRRTKAEAYMGLALLHGFRGDLAAAEDAAREGLRIVEQSGDERTAAQLWTSLGAVAVANDAPEAYGWLEQALNGFRTSKDTYGQAVAYLWLSVGHYRVGDEGHATRYAIGAFELAKRHGYGGLLTAQTLFGPRDRMMLVPILLAARDSEPVLPREPARVASGRLGSPRAKNHEPAKEATPALAKNPAWGSPAQSLLHRGFPEIASDSTTHTYHPGVTLRIQAFGPLRVWCGNREIGPREWQRKKAQQMFALFLTNRDHWLLREQICDRLWPDEAPSEAEAQFKVTLSGLTAALEPLRPPRTPPYYIRRQGGAYRFCPPDGVWLDVAEFEALLSAAGAASTGYSVPANADAKPVEDFALDTRYSALTRAVELHQGEYLSDWLYEDWARDERERLESLYMEAATKLAEALAARNEPSEAIRLCESVLARDPGWEDAYCVLMRTYALQGQRRMALATYERCVRNLRDYLDVEPLPNTVRIYEDLKA